MEYYSAIKNEIIPFTATWMALEIIILSEVSQRERVKYYMVLLIIESKKMESKNDTNELTDKRETNSQT